MLDKMVDSVDEEINGHISSDRRTVIILPDGTAEYDLLEAVRKLVYSFDMDSEDVISYIADQCVKPNLAFIKKACASMVKKQKADKLPAVATKETRAELQDSYPEECEETEESGENIEVEDIGPSDFVEVEKADDDIFEKPVDVGTIDPSESCLKIDLILSFTGIDFSSSTLSSE